MRPLVPAAVTAAIFLAGCVPASDSPLAQIGTATLRRAELAARTRFVMADDPRPADPEALAFRQLADAAVRAEIMARYGRPAGAAQLQAEAARIQKETLAPEKLAEYRKLFATESAWLEAYVKPIWTARESYFGLFARDLRFHARQAEALRQFAARHARRAWPEISRQARRENFAARRQGLAATGPDDPLARRLQALKPGRFTDPFLEDAGISVARVGARSSAEGAPAEVFSLPPSDFSGWLNAELKNVPIRCSSAICERFVRSLGEQPLF